MQRDLHGARGGAGAAQRGGVRQRRRLAQPDEQRQQHRAHRPRVHRPVRRAASLAVHRAHVQAGAAADAGQHLAVAAAKQVRPPVVENDDVHLLRPVGLPLAARPGEERRVDRELLPRGRPRKQAQQHGEVGGRRHEPLHAHDRHVHARDRRDEPRVALVGDKADRAGGRDPEVRAGDPDVCVQERLAQLRPGGVRQRLELGRDPLSLHRREQLSHLLGGLLDRRRDDVHGVLAGELEDVLAEIGLDRSDAHGRERLVQADLLGRHRLRLRGQLRARVAAHARDVLARLRTGAREEDLAAARLERLGEPRDVPVEVVDHGHLDPVRALPHRLDVREPLPRCDAIRPQPVGRGVERRLGVRVAELPARDLAEARRRLRELGHRTPRASALARCTTRTGDPTFSARPRRCIRHPGSAVTIARAVGARELVVRHRQRDLGLPHRERPAEPAAEVRAARTGRAPRRTRRAASAARRDPELAKHVARVVVGDPPPVVPRQRPEAACTRKADSSQTS